MGSGPLEGLGRRGRACSAYLHVVVLAVVCDSQQGAVVALQGLPARGDLKLLQLLQLSHGPPPLLGSPGSPLVLRLTLPLIGRSAFPPSHCFWFPLLERPKPTCKGQTCSFRHKRKLVPAPWACASLSPAQAKGEAGGPLRGPSPPIPPSRGSQGRGGCDCSLGLERKLQRGLGWDTGGRGLACSGGGDGFSTHGRGGKGRGWGLPWEARG